VLASPTSRDQFTLSIAMSDEEGNGNASGSGSDNEKKVKPKKKKTKKGKTEGPKKPPSTYMLFTQKQRPLLKKEKPEATFVEIGRILGERWKELPTEEKAPYLAQYKELKEKYDAEKGDDGKKGKKRKKAGSGAPKKPLSAYMFFAKEQRSIVQGENPNASFGELGKLLGEKWKRFNR